MKQVEIFAYHQDWPHFFKQEAEKIQSLLAHLIKEIYHIGSTAIPNMPAKPIIDIMLVCHNIFDIDKIEYQLQSLGYSQFSRQMIPYYSFFSSRYDQNIGFHLHIYEQNDPQIKRHICFRDYLIADKETAKEYAQLKLDAAQQFKESMHDYTLAKAKLVQSIDAQAKQWARKDKQWINHYANPKKLLELSAEQLTHAINANLNVHMTHFAQYLDQVALIRIPGYTIVNSHLSDDTFNYVLDAHFSEANAKQKIAEIESHFKNIPFLWWVGEVDQPHHLPNLLEENAYQNTENNIAMFLDLDHWQPNDNMPKSLKIVQAKDEKTLRDFALILTNDEKDFATYYTWIAAILTDDDPIEYYVGYVDGKPVVRGLICYYAGVAGLYWLSTVPDERHKGYASAMQAYRLQRAKQRGYHLAVLQASYQGYSLYRRLGYQECGVFKEYKLGDQI